MYTCPSATLTLPLPARVQEGDTPTSCAAYKGEKEALEMLIKANANVNTADNVRCLSCVCVCVCVCVWV